MSDAHAPIETLPRSLNILLGTALLALAAFPFVGTDYYLQMVTRMMILAIFAMSLDLLQGVTGLVSLGHAAYFGVAGYALAFITPPGEPIALWWWSLAALGRSKARSLRHCWWAWSIPLAKFCCLKLPACWCMC